MENFAEKSGHRSRLRSRFLSGGISALAEYEIVELLLTFSIPRKDVKPIAKSLLARYKNLKGILNASHSEIALHGGIGESSASLLRLVREIIPLYHLQTLEKASIELDSVDKLIEFFRARMESESMEVLEMACFDSELRLIPNCAVRLFEGSANFAKVDMRRIVEIAIRSGASSIVIAHNHPHGDARPSYEDIDFTRKLSLVCKPINICFIEHLIVAKDATFSFRRDGHFDDLYDISVPDQCCGDVASPKKNLQTA